MTRYRLVPEEALELLYRHRWVSSFALGAMECAICLALAEKISEVEHAPTCPLASVFVPSDAQVEAACEAAWAASFPGAEKPNFAKAPEHAKRETRIVVRAAIASFLKAVAEEPAERAAGSGAG